MTTPNPARQAGVLLAGVFGVAAVVVGVLFVAARQAANAPRAAPSPVQAVTSTAGATTTPSGTPASTVSTDPQVAAQASLVAARAQTLQGLSLDGRWVLQLSSKTDGIVDDLQTVANGTHVFHHTDIEAQFEQLRAHVRGAGMGSLVLTANDFGTKRTPGGDQMWVLLADPGNVRSQAVAQAACASLFPDKSGAALANACVPRTLVPLP